MNAKLKPLSKEEDIQAIPPSEPVLIELPSAPSGYEGGGGRPSPQDDGTEALRKQVEASQNAAKIQEAELLKANQRAAEEARRNADLAAQLERAKIERSAGEETAATHGLRAAQEKRDSAKLALKKAFADADAEAMAEAQSSLGRAEAEILNWEHQAAALAERKREATSQTTRQSSPQQQDIIAQIDSRSDLLPDEKSWLRSHPDAVIDPARNAELGVAYNRAMKQNLTRGTPEYFGFLEEFMGYKKPATDSGENTMTSAPVTRQSTSPSGTVSGGRVELNPDQRAMARSLGLTDIEYAAQVLQLNDKKRAEPEKYGRTV